MQVMGTSYKRGHNCNYCCSSSHSYMDFIFLVVDKDTNKYSTMKCKIQ